MLINSSVQRSSRRVLLPLALTVATLYFAKDFLIPLALAILISFLLVPLIRRLERWRFPRVLAVLTATFLAFSLIGAIGYIVFGQLIDLADQLPGYRSNLHEKVASLKTTRDSPISKATDTLREVTKEITSDQPVAGAAETPGAAAGTPSTTPGTGAPAAPVSVAVVEGPGNSWDTVKTFVSPLLAPLGTAALVIIFVIFILLSLEDLRDRVIHLIGRGHLHVTTQAIDEAGQKVTRYLLAQLIVNVTYGIPIGVGLYFIGIPNAVLWGLLATVLRFIPYIGPWIAASFPVFLSLAVSPGWSVPLMTLGLFVVIELISNNVVEPWLYGSSTGLSPVAVIVAAAFWTWLWGPIGLLLATPLTVCIAVLGKYIPSLSFLDVLLGDRPPIAPEDRFYQRLLAEDAEEICEIAENHTKEHSLVHTFEEVIIPALKLAETDYRDGVVTEEKRRSMHSLVRELVLEVGEEEAPEVKEKRTEAGTVTTSPLPEQQAVIVCLPACNEADELCAHMLARLLAQSGLAVQVCPSKLLTSEMVEQAREAVHNIALVSVLPPSSVLPASLVCKRLRASMPDVRILVGLWGDGEIEARRRARFERSGADALFTSLTQAEREIIAQVREELPMAAPAPDEPVAA
jgi:predicted PurR-regulated permease PerM/methylmalonyl-CoA mutase cobalamin-binding subunit